MRVEYQSRTSRAGSPWVVSRAAVLVTFVVVAIGVACALAGSGWGEVLHRVVVDGALLVAWLVAGYGIGASFLVRARELDGAPVSLRVCVRTALGIGAIGIVLLLLGLAGLLNRTAAAGVIVVGVLLAIWRLRAELGAPVRGWFGAPARWGWVWLLVAPVAGIVLAAALVPPGLLWGNEPNGYDVVEYHLQVPREWYEAARIVPRRHNVFSYFPMGMEVHYLLAMHLRGGPWAGMYLAQLMHVAMAGLTVLAVYGVLKQERRSQPGAAVPHVVGPLIAMTPWLSLLAPVAYNECALLLYETLAIGLLLRALDAPDAGVLAAIAGACAGFSCGAKLTGLAMVVLTPPIAIALSRLLNPSLLRGAVIPIVLYVAFAALTFSPWLIRTAVWTRGNPIFPESTNVFGRAHWTDEQVERWHQANHLPATAYRSATGRLTELWRQVIADARYGYVLLPLALFAAVMTWRHSSQARSLVIVLILMIVQWLWLSHLQSRFLTPIIPVCAMLIGLVQWRAWRTVCGVAVIVSTGWCSYTVGGKLLDLDHRIGGIGPAIGLEDLSPLVTVDLKKLPPDAPIVLVGDAKAFLYPQPRSRLSYTTVFDVLPPNDETPDITTWRAIDQPTTRPSPCVYVIDPGEWRRLARTYRFVPPPPPDVAQHNEPYVIVR